MDCFSKLLAALSRKLLLSAANAGKLSLSPLDYLTIRISNSFTQPLNFWKTFVMLGIFERGAGLRNQNATYVKSGSLRALRRL